MAKQYGVKEHFVQANGLTFCVEERGPQDAPTIMMIMGLASQLTLWPDEFLNAIANMGYRVVCFDNRDIGLSDKITPTTKVDLASSFLKYKLGFRFEANYNLYDMAEDTVAIMDALDIDTAHVVGASMGGMIAQIVAARHSSRVQSLNLMMTSNNSPKQPLPSFEVLKRFIPTGLGKDTPKQAIQKSVDMWKAIQSSVFPMSHDQIHERITSDFERSYRPGGIIRQFQAILATGSIHSLLELINAPTMIIHGEHDPLIHPSNSHILAKKIPNAKHIPVYGMGHDLPEEFYVFFADLIHKNTLRVPQNIVSINSRSARAKAGWQKKRASFA